MRWTPGGVSQDIEDRRDEGGGGGGGGGFRGAHIGAGGLLLLVLLSVVFRRDLITPFLGLSGDGAPATSSRPVDAEANAQQQPMVQFVSFVLDDVQSTWDRVLPEYGTRYRHAKLVLFRNEVDSACGLTEAATGPFYCPGDAKVYIDLSFYRELQNKFGAPGEFAEAYVIAHEVGHHVQSLLGTEQKVAEARRSNPSMANRLSVLTELQADCYAGIWGHSTQQRNIIDNSDVEQGLNAAAAIGDDRLQKMATGRVMPERFTHGSSAQRVQWFKRGLDSGDLRMCNTFAQ